MTPTELPGEAWQGSEENLADYLLRSSPPTWDYKTVLNLARDVARGRADATAAAPDRSEGLRAAQAALERDRTLVADGVKLIKDVLHGYDWLITSRGCYEWDDDKWHEEFKRASEALWEAIKPLERVAADLSNCPTNDVDVKSARATLAATAQVTGCGCDSSKGILCDEHHPVLQDADKVLAEVIKRVKK